MKRNTIIVVLLLLVIGGFIGFRMFNEKTPDIVNKKPEAGVNAQSLVAAFDADTASAVKQYLDKIIEVTGTVKRIDTTGSVILGEEGMASEVVIGLDRRHMNDYKKLKIGTPAVMQGVCSGYSKSNGDDLLASLGTTVELRSAGVKNKN